MGFAPDLAADHLHSFIADKVLAKNLLAQAAPEKGGPQLPAQGHQEFRHRRNSQAAGAQAGPGRGRHLAFQKTVLLALQDVENALIAFCQGMAAATLP